MRKTLAVICLIFVIITVYEISTSYAKYVSEVEGTMEKPVGAWVIKVNDNDISASNTSHNFNINNLTFLESSYVAPGKLAPNTEAYFDIDIDPTGTSVAIRFDVTLDFSDLNVSDSIYFDYACKVVNGIEETEGMIRTAANTYTGIMTLDEVLNNQITTARFYVLWDGSDDASDMILGTNDEGVSLDMPIEVVVSQYFGETITEFETP